MSNSQTESNIIIIKHYPYLLISDMYSENSSLKKELKYWKELNNNRQSTMEISSTVDDEKF